jgi:hypothetical protein
VELYINFPYMSSWIWQGQHNYHRHCTFEHVVYQVLTVAPLVFDLPCGRQRGIFCLNPLSVAETVERQCYVNETWVRVVIERYWQCKNWRTRWRACSSATLPATDPLVSIIFTSDKFAIIQNQFNRSHQKYIRKIVSMIISDDKSKVKLY